MNFRDYKWFNNPRGLRNNGPYTALNAEHYTNPRMGWAKLEVGGTEHVGEVGRLLGHGCMPVIQIYRERMGAALADEAWFDVYAHVYAQYVKAGALWFELYDEPNMPAFWPLDSKGHPDPAPDWADQERCIAPVMDHWLDWAERIVALGAYPAFPAMAETIVPEQATVAWYETCLGYLAGRRADRFGRLMASGLWCAVHPYVLNHFYQEPPGGPPSAARPYYQQSHKESGWHFEYPYDPLQQHDDPGRTPFGGTGKTGFGDPNGLVCSGEIFTELLMKMFGAGPVPVLGTAGGITPIPAASAEPVQQDARYQGYNRDSHAEATAAMMRWIAESGPPWLFGLALSSEADYYESGAAIPAIGLLAAEPPVNKEVPDLDIRVGKAAQALINAAMEPSAEATSPGAAGPEEGAAPEGATPPSGAPTGEPAKSEAELGDLANLNLFIPEPPIAAQEPPASPAAEPAEPPDTRLKMPEPLDMTLKPVEPADTTLKEVEPVDSTLKEVEPPVSTLAEPGPFGDPYAAVGMSGTETPPPAHEEPPDVIAMPAVTPPHEEAPEPAPVEPEPGEPEPSGTVLWPAPDAREEAPAPPQVEPEAEEPETSGTVLWPAPDAREEAPDAGPVAARPESSSAAEKLGPGPGPLVDAPSDHWLMPAPDLPADWLVGAARYWDAFHTPIVGDANLIGALPQGRSLAVTLLAPRDTAGDAAQALADNWPNVQIDVVWGDTLAEVQAEFDRRAREMKEYG